MSLRTSVASTLLATAAILVPTAPAAAQVAATAIYDLPAQELETSLRAVARTSGQQIIIASSAVEGRTAPALKGQFTVEEAVRSLLAGAPVRMQIKPDAILIGDSEPASAADKAVSEGEAITVTGSRIKGAVTASPEIRIDHQEIMRAGYSDMGEALRALPQNFGGGQNPGLGIGALGGGITNQNVTGGSAVNLRGLGPDATLTLLNGHRLSFGGLAQGVDISTIPTDVVDRVEVVPDGASALYGSDAVAGVVNVVLRQSLDGLSLRTRLGSSTDGGGFSQQYQAALGQQWDGGHVLATYSYRRDSQLKAIDRSYTASLGEIYPLIPGQSDHSALLSASQDIAGGGEMSIDATFNKRYFSRDFLTFGVLQLSDVRDQTYAIAPTLSLPIGPAWKLSTSGVYAKTKTNITASQYLGAILLGSDSACYCHSLFGIETFAEGPLLAIPGGTIRAVLGGGYRSNKLELIGRASKRGGSEKDRYAFGELSIPLVSPGSGVAWARSITITAAGRYDNYGLTGDVFTPRAGLVYSPTSDLDLKYSWGKSFKAPSLFQQFDTRAASLSPVRSFGVTNAPAGATGLAFSGGSQDLRPERATTQTWSINVHPQSVPGFVADVSYFRVKYTDRVLAPIGNYRDALNPAYSDSVIINPTAVQIQTALAETALFINNVGGTFDPSKVLYLINNYNRNVAEQRIQGVDASLSYSRPLGQGSLSGSIGGSWLESEQKSSPGTAYFDLAGTAWRPPHWRMRGSIGWADDGLELFAYVNYTGGVQDRRVLPYRDGSGMTTADISISYTIASSNKWIDETRAQIVVNNVLNQKPPFLQPSAFAEPYDSTNYSPIGRYVSITLAHTF